MIIIVAVAVVAASVVAVVAVGAVIAVDAVIAVSGHHCCSANQPLTEKEFSPLLMTAVVGWCYCFH